MNAGHKSLFQKLGRKILAVSVFSLLVFVLSVSAGAQKKNFLWSVSDQSGVRLHILGSIHLAKENLYPLDPVIQEAFADSAGLVVEVNAEEMDQALMAKELLIKGVYSDGGNLWDELDPPTAAQLRNALSGTILTEEAVSPMKPWLVGMTLEVQKLLALGYVEEMGLDRHFIRLARQRSLPVGELESAMEQLEVLSSFSEGDGGLRYLQVTLIEIGGIEEGMEKLFKTWTSGDVKGFEDIYFSTFEERPEFFPILEKLIYRRNENMLRRLQPYLADSASRTFVVVGAAHLVGPKGLLASLEAQGYKVEQR
ncbi:MAG: TraB/GumN family protein [Deltaproteobacteria bacterium]|nr:TraB/GumN family protein [Deltaproteobacteria bacterium]